LWYNGTIERNKGNKMTRKHFRTMAQNLMAIQDLTQRKVAAEAFADVAASANPRFNRTMFLAACGL
jgi:hypothetical protein